MAEHTQPHPPHPSAHDILVADDDPATRQFLTAALASLGYRVTLAEDGGRAIDLAREHRYSALLLDCRMPVAGAHAVLVALRDDPSARSHDAVALATSAEVPAELRETLLAAGFAGVVEKPCKVASLGHALTATLGPGGEWRTLDDEAGLMASGDRATMGALRQLLRSELLELDAALDALAHDPGELTERMHRLRSACGFCGTARLGAQAKALQNHVLETRVAVPQAVKRFRAELQATLDVLT